MRPALTLVVCNLAVKALPPLWMSREEARAVVEAELRALNLIYGSAAHRKSESSNGIAVRINLSGLGMELSLRAIMEIRAQLSFLQTRPREGPVRLPGFSCAD
jgi:hypothetical protein